jgi:hypothetical protein
MFLGAFDEVHAGCTYKKSVKKKKTNLYDISFSIMSGHSLK